MISNKEEKCWKVLITKLALSGGGGGTGEAIRLFCFKSGEKHASDLT